MMAKLFFICALKKPSPFDKIYLPMSCKTVLYCTLFFLNITTVFSQNCQPGTYDVNFPEEPEVSISACVDEKASFVSQSVYWQKIKVTRKSF
jgi:hypothetical protein